MAHPAEPHGAHAAATSVDEIGHPRVLVLAYPDLEKAIYEALAPAKARDGDTPPRGAEGPDDDARSVSQLCLRAFPGRAPEFRPSKRSGALRGLFQPSRGVSIASAEVCRQDGQSSSLFEWGDYDFVIIQDLWASRPKDGPPTLETAGYELAHLDYYERGNFNTKKVILVTDEEFPKEKWVRGGGDPNHDFKHIVGAAFDEKDALLLIHLGSGDVVKQLRDIVFGKKDAQPPGGANGRRHGVRPAGGDGGDSQAVTEFRRGVKLELADALRNYIRARAEVILVDDEWVELETTYSALTGRLLKPLAVTDGQRRPHECCVLIAVGSSPTAMPEKKFDDLVRVCENKFDEAIAGGKEYVLFVTDILFKHTSWEKTGIDLIQELRRSLTLRAAARFGIVAFTGFTTPFIAMSSYQRGADFVVPKLIRGRHDTGPTGTDRLLVTLSALCFQKTFLRDKRRAVELHKSPKALEVSYHEKFACELRKLQAVLPRHTVSLHLRQEWLDTCYLLDAMTIYEAGSPHLSRIFQEVSEKYD